MKAYVDIRWILFVTLLPLILGGLFVLTVLRLDQVRYDPAHFTQDCIERYDTPGMTSRILAHALQTDDQALLAELQGLRRPAPLETGADVEMIMLWERGGRYYTYMYQNMQTLQRHPHYVEQVDGRWVVSPADAHYYLHSGRWLTVYVPLLLFWWLVEAVVVLAVWVYRAAAHQRALMYGD